MDINFTNQQFEEIAKLNEVDFVEIRNGRPVFKFRDGDFAEFTPLRYETLIDCIDRIRFFNSQKEAQS